MNRGTLTALVVAMSLGSGGAAQAQTALNKPTPGGSSIMRATAVSADGSVIVGNFHDANHFSDVCRWTQAGGAQDLGIRRALPTGVSADGSVIVGSITDAHWNERPFRWTRSGGARDLGSSWRWMRATGVSADGSVVVGVFHDAHNVPHVFRWTQSGGAQDLGIGHAWIPGVSADGSVIVGTIDDTLGHAHRHVFRWTQSGGAQNLGTMGGLSADAAGVSADGSVIVGSFDDAPEPADVHVFRWTQSGGAQNLGTMGGLWAGASGVSADGSVIVGVFADASGGHHVYRWTQSRGSQDLGAMGGLGAQATGVSADGSVILGDDGNGRPFRWTQSGGAQDLGNVTALSRLIYAAWTLPIIASCLISAAIAGAVILIIAGRRRRAARGDGPGIRQRVADHTMRSRVYLYSAAVLISLSIFLVRAAAWPAFHAATAPAIDVCSLLSQTELSAAVGAPMAPQKSSGQCLWNSSQPIPGRPTRIVLLTLALATLYDQQKVTSQDITTIPGLGDDAYYISLGTAEQLYIKKGDLEVKVLYVGPLGSQEEAVDVEKTIAAQVLSKL